jgi:hypothetical protein
MGFKFELPKNVLIECGVWRLTMVMLGFKDWTVQRGGVELLNDAVVC